MPNEDDLAGQLDATCVGDSQDVRAEPTSRCIGFLADAAYSEYTARFMAGVMDRAEEHGYTVQRFRLREFGHNAEMLKRCLDQRLAGVVVHDPDFCLHPDELAQAFTRGQTPFVLLSSQFLETNGPAICSDDAMGARAAVEYLVGLGHKRITLCAGRQGIGTSVSRSAGYEAAMLECGLAEFIDIRWLNWNGDLLELYLAEAFAALHPPTAFLCCSDPIALSVLNWAVETGMRVPRDYSVIGFGNLLRTDYSSPGLTTVTVPYEEMGREAVRLLLDDELRSSFHDPQQEKIRRHLPTSLLVRRSTAAPGHHYW